MPSRSRRSSSTDLTSEPSCSRWLRFCYATIRWEHRNQELAEGVWKQGGSSSLWNLMVHNGTTLTKVATSSTTMPTGQIQRFTVYSDGAGTVKLYINGTEVASTSAGPTGTRADTRFWCSVKQTASAATRILAVLWYPKVSSAP